MRILLVTYYFPPDLCAGSFRAQSMVDALVAQSDNVTVDVVTTEPNRYQSHQPDSEEVDSTSYTVTRAPLPTQRYGMLGQVRSFGRYAWFANRFLPSKEYDLVVATSSRLMTAFLGAVIARRLKVPLYLDIRDIFVETVDEVFTATWMKPFRLIFSMLERWTVSRADRVNLVSRGFLPYFESRYSRTDYRFFTNGVDEEFLAFPEKPASASGKDAGLLTIVYAGNVGDGQGLELILPELALRMKDRARFVVIGDGGKLPKLKSACEHLSAPVELRGAMPRSELLKVYQGADVLFLHLNNLPAFTRVLPSKLFEYAATGKPILAGVQGYARNFIESELDGAETFDPGDVGGAESALDRLQIGHFDRQEFVKQFDRRRIMKEMAADIMDLAEQGRG